MKILQRILKYVLCFIPLSVISLFVIVVIASYLSCPLFDFQPGSSFIGSYWNNPYQEISQTSTWEQANFHVHSNTHGKLANGHKNDPERIFDVYKQLGYNIVSISDYQSIYQSEKTPYIPVYEHGFNIPKVHQLSLGAQKPFHWDYFVFQTAHQKQHIINALKKRSELVCLAHPAHWGGYSRQDIKILSNYDLFEVLNHYRISEDLWDTALSSGRLSYLLGNDDCHDTEALSEVARRFTLVNTSAAQAQDSLNLLFDWEKENGQILFALKHGQSIGVDFPTVENENVYAKAKRLQTLGLLKKFKLRSSDEGQILSVEIEGQKAEIALLGDRGKLICQVPISDSLHFYFYSKVADTIQTDSIEQQRSSRHTYQSKLADQTYIRAKIYWEDGSVFYLNPISRSKTSTRYVSINPLTAKTMLGQTWALRIMSLFLVSMLILNMIAWKKNRQSKRRRKNMLSRY